MDDVLQQLTEIAIATPVIKRMWVFGSRYKGTHTDASDLDLAIEVEWVKGQMLGVCENSGALWAATLPKFEDAMIGVCPWELDLHQYADATDSPNIHQYLQDASAQIYEKT